MGTRLTMNIGGGPAIVKTFNGTDKENREGILKALNKQTAPLIEQLRAGIAEIEQRNPEETQ